MVQKTAMFVIYSSVNGQDNWLLVKPEDVPEWVREPDVMGRLAKGYTAQNNRTEPKPGEQRLWYRAERMLPDSEVKVVQAAHAKRIRRAQKRIATLH